MRPEILDPIGRAFVPPPQEPSVPGFNNPDQIFHGPSLLSRDLAGTVFEDNGGVPSRRGFIKLSATALAASVLPRKDEKGGFSRVMGAIESGLAKAVQRAENRPLTIYDFKSAEIGNTFDGLGYESPEAKAKHELTRHQLRLLIGAPGEIATASDTGVLKQFSDSFNSETQRLLANGTAALKTAVYRREAYDGRVRTVDFRMAHFIEVKTKNGTYYLAASRKSDGTLNAKDTRWLPPLKLANGKDAKVMMAFDFGVKFVNGIAVADKENPVARAVYVDSKGSIIAAFQTLYGDGLADLVVLNHDLIFGSGNKSFPDVSDMALVIGHNPGDGNLHAAYYLVAASGAISYGPKDGPFDSSKYPRKAYFDRPLNKWTWKDISTVVSSGEFKAISTAEAAKVQVWNTGKDISVGLPEKYKGKFPSLETYQAQLAQLGLTISVGSKVGDNGSRPILSGFVLGGASEKGNSLTFQTMDLAVWAKETKNGKTTWVPYLITISDGNFNDYIGGGAVRCALWDSKNPQAAKDGMKNGTGTCDISRLQKAGVLDKASNKAVVFTYNVAPQFDADPGVRYIRYILAGVIDDEGIPVKPRKLSGLGISGIAFGPELFNILKVK